eukprot:3067785-Amphidinium_carterae.1
MEYLKTERITNKHFKTKIDMHYELSSISSLRTTRRRRRPGREKYYENKLRRQKQRSSREQRGQAKKQQQLRQQQQHPQHKKRRRTMTRRIHRDQREKYLYQHENEYHTLQEYNQN